MLTFSGLGLRKKEIPYKAVQALSMCDKAYVEFYTNQTRDLDWLETEADQEIIQLKRNQVEEEMVPVREARDHEVVFLASGHPFTATTHYELKRQAEKRDIDTRTIGSSSILNAPGSIGLDLYKFGRTVTLTGRGLLDSTEEKIDKNLSAGLHTLILVDPGMSQEKAFKALNDRYSGLIVQIYDLGGNKSRTRILKSEDDLQESGSRPCSFVLTGETSHKEEEYLDELR